MLTFQRHNRVQKLDIYRLAHAPTSTGKDTYTEQSIVSLKYDQNKPDSCMHAHART